MEDVRILILSAALLTIIGVGGLITTGNFGDVQSLSSNFGLIVISLLILVLAAYLIYRKEHLFNLKRIFIERSDEATIAYIRNELTKIKEYLESKGKINKKNAKTAYNYLVKEFKRLAPYKPYISKISENLVENMNKILSIEKLNSRNVSEFLLTVNKLKEELKEL
ncbi:MAG: hypothetical protein QXP34_00190 [Candidatus Aenigmatarchaeota archaeon]